MALMTVLVDINGSLTRDSRNCTRRNEKRGIRRGRMNLLPTEVPRIAFQSSYRLKTAAKNSSGVCVAGMGSVPAWPNAIHPLPIDSIICS